MAHLAPELIHDLSTLLVNAEQAIQETMSSAQRTGQPTLYAIAASQIRRLEHAPTASWNRIGVLHAVLALPDRAAAGTMFHALLPTVTEPDGLLSAQAAHALNAYLIPGDTWALEPLLMVIDAALAAAAQGQAQAAPPATQASIWAIGALRDRRAVPTLIALLNFPDHTLTDAAASVLGELGDRRVIAPLINAVQRSRNPEAALALGRLHATEAFEPLLEQWNQYLQAEMAAVARGIPTNTVEEDATVELMFGALAQALGRLGRQEAIQPLAAFIPFMDTYDQTVRLELAIALHRLGDEQAFGRITDALTDRRIGFRRRPARYLLERGDARALPTLITSYQTDAGGTPRRQTRIKTLSRFGDHWDVPLLAWIQQHDHTPSETEGWPLSVAAGHAITRIMARAQHQTATS